jgi:hypothetical protein
MIAVEAEGKIKIVGFWIPTCSSKRSTLLLPFERRWKHQPKAKSNQTA